jgi:site-specific recombinase XerD
MLRQGVNLPTIQKMMGHTDISTTQIYLSVYDEDVERAMKNFRGGSL